MFRNDVRQVADVRHLLGVGVPAEELGARVDVAPARLAVSDDHMHRAIVGLLAVRQQTPLL